MRKFLLYPTFFLWLTVLSMSHLQAATEPQAHAITEKYDRLVQLWNTEMKLAPDARSKAQIAKKHPDPAIFATKLKRLIARDLAKEWTLQYGAWILENDTQLKPESQRALLNALEKYHIKSPRVGRFCIAMTHLKNATPLRPGKTPLRSRGIKLLDQIRTQNPDPKVQGQAALAIAIMLRPLGDDPSLIKRRLSYLREAIVKSADVQVGTTSVAKLAENELYIIKHLSNGSIAPNIIGVDSAGRPLSLKDFRGKVVMLTFWSSWDAHAAEILKALKKTADSYSGKNFVLLGVNRDTLSNLRALEADQIVTWKNFSDPDQLIAKAYHIKNWPHCIILTPQGRIAYRGMPGALANAVVDDLLLSPSRSK